MTWICRSRSTSAKVSAASITSHPARRCSYPLRSSQVPTAMSRSTRRSSCPFEGSNATFGSSKTVLFQGVYLPGSERESDETATFTQLSSPAEPRGTRRWSPPSAWPRSEEHTSELQSLRHLVCRLLLEKKKDA